MFFRKKIVKSLSVYVSSIFEQIIIAPQHENKSGIIYEQDKCLVFDIKIPFAELGVHIKKNLGSYSIKDLDLRDRKEVDWPAFKASNSKSVKEFKKNYIFIAIKFLDETLIEIVRFLPESKNFTINSILSIHQENEVLGQRVKDLCNFKT